MVIGQLPRLLKIFRGKLFIRRTKRPMILISRIREVPNDFIKLPHKRLSKHDHIFPAKKKPKSRELEKQQYLF